MTEFTKLQEKHEKDKKLWVSSMQVLNAKIQALKGDYHKLSEEARANSFPDISGITSVMQSLSVQYEDLKKKYTEENKERKQLYNELLELKGNIRVFCRFRPLSAEEIAAGASSVVEFDKSKDNEFTININGASKKNFKFDRVFTPEDNQEDVFFGYCSSCCISFRWVQCLYFCIWANWNWKNIHNGGYPRKQGS